MITKATAVRVQQEIAPKLRAWSVHSTFLISDINDTENMSDLQSMLFSKATVAPYDEIHGPAVKSSVDRGETPLREAVNPSRDGVPSRQPDLDRTHQLPVVSNERAGSTLVPSENSDPML